MITMTNIKNNIGVLANPAVVNILFFNIVSSKYLINLGLFLKYNNGYFVA